MSDGSLLPEALLDGFVELSQGNFAHRLERTFARDGADRAAFLFNSIAEELDRFVNDARANELRLEASVGAISDALTRVVAGDFEAKIERDYRGDPPDVLAFLVNSTIEELGHQVAENQRRAEENRRELERQVEERTRQLTASETSFRTLFEAAPVAICLVDRRSAEIIAANVAAQRLFGASAETLLGASPVDFLREEERENARELLRGPDASGERAIDVITPRRGVVHCLLQTTVVELGDAPVIVASLVDLTDRKRAEDTLRELATRDPLTELLNRRSFTSLTEDLLIRCRAEAHPFTLAMIDIDHFKSVNDAFGHPVGDEALRRLAACLTQNVRSTDLVARYGGEEFALALPNADGRRARETAERIRSAVEAIELTAENARVPLTISVGLAEFAESESLDDALARADEALYRAKNAGRNRVHD